MLMLGHLMNFYLWSGTCRWVYPLGVAFIVLPSLLGKNRLITGFLNNSFFLILARLSYCAYLIHYIILSMDTAAAKGTFYATDWTIFFDWCTNLLLTFGFSIILILLVESPFVNIETKFIMKRSKPEKENIVEPRKESYSTPGGIIHHRADFAKQP